MSEYERSFRLCSLMYELQRCGGAGLTVSKLASLTRWSRPTIQREVDKLTYHGLMTYEALPHRKKKDGSGTWFKYNYRLSAACDNIMRECRNQEEWAQEALFARRAVEQLNFFHALFPSEAGEEIRNNAG